MQETGNKSAPQANIDLVDETFDVSQSESYHLSLQIAEEGLSLCVFNTVVDKYLLLRHYPFSGGDSLIARSGEVLECDELLRLPYKNCSALWVSPRSTLVPEHLFDERNAGKYLNFNHGAEQDEQALYHYICAAQLYHVFSLPDVLKTMVESYQPHVRWFHHGIPLIERMPAQAKPVAVFFYGKHMDVVIRQNRQMAFYNTFQVDAPEDAVYYLASVLNLFDLQLSSVHLVYAGHTEDISRYADHIRQYIAHVAEGEPLATVTYSHYLTDPLRKRFIHLFNLYGCVS
jgi:hypothetical protein